MATTTVETRPSRGAELLGLVAFALALMLLIALATFDPRDPAPFFKAGVEGPARNFIGPFGAFLAEMLVPQLFGLAALLLPLVLGLVGWKLFWCTPIEAPYTKAVGNLVLLLSLAGLLSLAVGTFSYEGETVRAGGAEELGHEHLGEERAEGADEVAGGALDPGLEERRGVPRVERREGDEQHQGDRERDEPQELGAARRSRLGWGGGHGRPRPPSPRG